jgi:hypothetical protein
LRAALKPLVPEAWWQAGRRRYIAGLCRNADRRENRRLTRSDAPMLVVSQSDDVAHAYAAWLAWAEHSRPGLRRAIRLGRVPGANVGSAQLLHAWVQDPVRERDPCLHRQLEALEAGIRGQGGQVVNPACVLSHSLRDVMRARLEGLPLRLPAVTRLESDTQHAAPERYPVMVRPRWGHGGPMELLSGAGEWHAWRRRTRGTGGDWVVTEFIDVRDADGFYRKYRYLSFGTHGIARHLIVSPHWEVRPKDRVITDATRAEELAFVHGATSYVRVLEQARLALGFDIAAFDFSYDAERNLVLWEVNPYPDLSPPRTAAGKYLQPVVEASYAALADFYEERLAQPRSRETPGATVG